jgi:tRNA:m4X modification enzyme
LWFKELIIHFLELQLYLFYAILCWTREPEKADQEAIGIERIIRSIPAGERASFGSMCKDIIDTGRLLWLGQKGLVADLVSYVPSNISPENRLLIAKCTS